MSSELAVGIHDLAFATTLGGGQPNTFRLAGRANIAHARRDLHDRADTLAVYDI